MSCNEPLYLTCDKTVRDMANAGAIVAFDRRAQETQLAHFR